MKDHCTWWPDTFRGVYIGDPCCKEHDELNSTSLFAKCLYKKFRMRLSKNESRFWTVIITTGGGIGCWVKCPIKMWNRI